MFAEVSVLVFSVAGTVFTAYRSLRIWHDPAYYERVSLAFRYGDFPLEVRRRLMRGWLPLAVGFAALTLFGSVNLLAQAAALQASAVVGGAQVALLALFALGCVLMLVVAVFNAPKVLVPVYLREEPGIRGSRPGRRDPESRI